MSAEKLVNALRQLAQKLYQMRDEAEGDGSRWKDLDHAALSLEVCAHICSGKSVERAFGAPGDWGYGTPIGDGLRAFLSAPRDESGIRWTYVEDELPDDDVRVMIAIDNPHSDEPSFGYHENGRWFFDDGDTVSDECPVYAWAHVPSKPAKKGART